MVPRSVKTGLAGAETICSTMVMLAVAAGTSNLTLSPTLFVPRSRTWIGCAALLAPGCGNEQVRGGCDKSPELESPEPESDEPESAGPQPKSVRGLANASSATMMVERCMA